MQRACGTSLEAAILLGNKIALGQIDSAIAAGVDTVSDPPVVYPKAFQQLLLKSYRGKTAGGRLSPWFGLRFKHLRPVLPGTAEPRTGLDVYKRQDASSGSGGVAGITGTPALAARLRASILLPSLRIVSANGPTKRIRAAAHASANSGLSDRKP